MSMQIATPVEAGKETKVKMPRERRQDLINTIEEKRGSKVIAYVTSSRPGLTAGIGDDVVPIIYKHLKTLKPEECEKLDLFIYSHGGAGHVPWTIVSMFREYPRTDPEAEDTCSFNVLIPYRAHSAATVIAMGADEIVMTRKSELGPIDATIPAGHYNPTDEKTGSKLPLSVEDVKGYFLLMEKLGMERPDEKIKGFELLAGKVNPMALGQVSRTLEETELVASRLLNTRSKKGKFTEEENKQIVKKLSSEIYSHHHTIGRYEAKKCIGLKQVTWSEAAGKNMESIDDELWALYEEYVILFEMEKIFKPEDDIIINNKINSDLPNLAFACVESNNRLDVFRADMRVSRSTVQNPPNIKLEVKDIQLPSITIPNTPPNADQGQINALIQQIFNNPQMQQYIGQGIQLAVDKATKKAINDYILSLPNVVVKKYLHNEGWRQEG